MRIIVDMDEVLAQFVNRVLERWNMINRTKFKRDDIDAWQMESTLGPGSYGLIEKWISEPNFFENLVPVDGAIEGFNELRRSHDVVIATSLAGEVENGFDSKRRWVKKYFPDFDLKNFICTSRKDLLKGDVLIDDAAHYLQAWRDAGNIRGITMHARWNRDMTLFPKAANWRQVVNIIRFYQAHDEYLQLKNQFHDEQDKLRSTLEVFGSVKQ